MAAIENLDSKARDSVMMRALVFHRCILAEIDALLAFVIRTKRSFKPIHECFFGIIRFSSVIRNQ